MLLADTSAKQVFLNIITDIMLLQNGTVIDRLRSYTALRSIGVQRERLLLNGRSFNMRLVLDQGYWPDTLMTPLSAVADKCLRDLEVEWRVPTVMLTDRHVVDPDCGGVVDRSKMQQYATIEGPSRT